MCLYLFILIYFTIEGGGGGGCRLIFFLSLILHVEGRRERGLFFS